MDRISRKMGQVRPDQKANEGLIEADIAVGRPTATGALSWHCLVCGADVGELSDADAASLRLMQIHTVSLDTAAVQATTHREPRQLPADCPPWAASLNDCEVRPCVLL